MSKVPSTPLVKHSNSKTHVRYGSWSQVPYGAGGPPCFRLLGPKTRISFMTTVMTWSG